MRPSEIDYTNIQPHYLDVTNGEILAGEAERQEYLVDITVNPEMVKEIGQLLSLPPDQARHYAQERLDVSSWDREKYLEYGRWLVGIAADPVANKERLNQDILRNARYFGLGAGQAAIREIFTKFGAFYTEVGTGQARTYNNFKDWDVYDFIQYIKKVGGNKRPHFTQFKKLSKEDPSKPSHSYMHNRFKHIGGYLGLIELAGYTVVRRWDRQDFIDWGVAFMETNEGLLPGKYIFDYFCGQQIGPSADVIAKRFDSIGDYQKAIIQAYEARQREKIEVRNNKLDIIETDFIAGCLPPELFIIKQDFQHQLDQLGPKEVLSRYAKFKVVETLVPAMSFKAKVAIAKGEVKDRGFTASIRKHYSRISPGKIENTALVMGYFDDIWPLDKHSNLVIDKKYEAYYLKKSGYKYTRPHLRTRIPIPC